jgi:glycosyltransferase involved in cell wall biosynthesis
MVALLRRKDPTRTSGTIRSEPASSAHQQPRPVVLSAYRFPHGDAMSNRLLQLARSATHPGTRALIVNDWPNDGTSPEISLTVPAEVELLTLTAARGGLARRYMLRQARPFRVLRIMRKHGVTGRSTSIVCIPEGLLNLTTLAVLRVLLRRPIVVDVTEQHDRAQFAKGWLAPYFVRHRWSAFLASRAVPKVITVSSRLGQYFANRGADVLVVPPQVDCAEFRPPSPPSLRDGLRLVYAGSPGTKDMLDILLEGIRQLPASDQARINLTIAGVTRSQATRLSDLRQSSMAALGDQVAFIGRIPRADVLDLLARSHFSVLVRPTGGYADYGFPSKVPESLAAGCPVMVNYTSDLARYIKPGREGIVLTGSTTDDVRRGLAVALTMDDGDWSRMSQAARARAMASFDYRVWASAVTEFVASPANRLDSSDPLSVGRRPHE